MELVNPAALIRLSIQWIQGQQDVKMERLVEKVRIEIIVRRVGGREGGGEKECIRVSFEFCCDFMYMFRF